MLKVYLDNNIILDIEDGAYSVEQFLSKDDCSYYFSQAHIEELLEAENNPKVSQEGRLNLITKLCGWNYILTGVTVPEFFDKEPIEMYFLVKNNIFRQFLLQNVYKGDKPALLFRQTLGFNSKQFNNETPEGILGIINDRMRNKLGIDLYTWLIQTEANNGRAIYHTLLQLIDMANYWGDKKTNHSNVARMYDAAHAYYAQICDVLVTNDTRMSKKVNAIYSFLNIKTKIVSALEFLNS